MATSRQGGASSSSSSSSTLSIVAAVALSAATAAGLYLIHHKRRTEEATSSASSSCSAGDGVAAVTRGGVPIPPGAVPEDAKEVLTQLFAEAAGRVKSLPDAAVAPADRLLAYALYKQATAGDRSSAGVPKPSKFNVIAHAKYTAWGKFEGMPRETAMIKYIEASHYLAAEDAERAGVELAAGKKKNSGGPMPVANDNADIVYTKEDEYRSSDEESDAEGDTSDLDDVFGSHKNDDAEVKGMGMRQSVMLQTEWEETESPACTDDGRLQQGSAAATTPRKRALIAAAMDGNLSDLRDAIDSGTDIAEADESGQTALHFAADRGFAECVSLLLDNGADANSTDREGISVLQAAVIGGDVECVRLLLQAGADPDHRDADGDTPRSCANDDGSEEIKALFADAVV